MNKQSIASFDLYALPIYMQLDILEIPHQSFYTVYDHVCTHQKMPVVDSDSISPKEHQKIFVFLQAYNILKKDGSIDAAMLGQFDNLVNTQYANTVIEHKNHTQIKSTRNTNSRNARLEDKL